jgi:ferredoxin-NADP reductase
MWRVATVTALRDETPSARTLTLDVSGWSGHDAGQHVDVRLTAADGYSTVRSYSIASAPAAQRVELTVEQLPDGEVSPYLAHELAIGDSIEIRGPLGGWFVWRAQQPERVQLIAGGSGLVPLMSMVRARAEANSSAPFRLLYSVRRPQAVLYASELQQRSNLDGVAINYAYTREVPDGWTRAPQRVDAQVIAAETWAPDLVPTCYVCGPTAFVEVVADLLVSAGHNASHIRTERFGPTGGQQ